MPRYRQCPFCGSNIDHDERCDCRNERVIQEVSKGGVKQCQQVNTEESAVDAQSQF